MVAPRRRESGAALRLKRLRERIVADALRRLSPAARDEILERVAGSTEAEREQWARDLAGTDPEPGDFGHWRTLLDGLSIAAGRRKGTKATKAKGARQRELVAQVVASGGDVGHRSTRNRGDESPDQALAADVRALLPFDKKTKKRRSEGAILRDLAALRKVGRVAPARRRRPPTKPHS